MYVDRDWTGVDIAATAGWAALCLVTAQHMQCAHRLFKLNISRARLEHASLAGSVWRRRYLAAHARCCRRRRRRCRRRKLSVDRTLYKAPLGCAS